MYYSSIFVFSLVVVFNLCGAQSKRFSGNYDVPRYGQDEVVNIGNGVGRTNVVVIDDAPSNDPGYQYAGTQRDELGNRFDVPQNPRPSPRKTVNSIGNGYYNHNKVVIGGSSDPLPTQQSKVSNAWSRGGQSFVSTSGTDFFHVGYGVNNDNQIFVQGRPAVPAPAASDRNNNQISNVFVNGQLVRPDRTDAYYSTYVVSGQTILVQNKETVSPNKNADLLKLLNEKHTELEKIKSQIYQLAGKLNIQL